MAELQISVVSDPASKRQIQVTTKSLTILVNYQKTNLIGELINSYNELVSSFIIVKLTRVSAIVVGFKAADFWKFENNPTRSDKWAGRLKIAKFNKSDFPSKWDLLPRQSNWPSWGNLICKMNIWKDKKLLVSCATSATVPLAKNLLKNLYE